MTSDEFAQRLVTLTPTEDELRAEGIPEPAIHRIIDSYNVRPFLNDVPRVDDPLIDLIQRYDLSTVEIGSIYLGQNQNWVSSPNHRIVGTEEADGLAIRKKDGKIVLLDHDCPSYVIAVVAADSGRALDAFFELARGLKRLPRSSKSERAAAAARCAAASGEPEAENYYATLLGVYA